MIIFFYCCYRFGVFFFFPPAASSLASFLASPFSHPAFFFGYSFFRYFALSVRAGKKCWVTLVVDPRKELRYFSDEGSKKAHLGSLLFFFFSSLYFSAKAIGCSRKA
jgi:hypothetical protein